MMICLMGVNAYANTDSSSCPILHLHQIRLVMITIGSLVWTRIQSVHRFQIELESVSDSLVVISKFGKLESAVP